MYRLCASGRRFEDEVLRAIVEACEQRGLDVTKFTEFDEAERRLAEWEEAAKEKKGVNGPEIGRKAHRTFTQWVNRY